MRRYRYSYHTIVSYSSMVTHQAFQLRSSPRESSCQRVAARVIDHLTQVIIRSSEDCFGNPIHYGSMPYPHDIFVAASQGIVECDPYRVEEPQPSPIYLAESCMTKLNAALTHFSIEVAPNSGTALQRALSIANAIYERMIYEAGVTTTETTAAMSFELGRGVCQDFAHILIAVCRKFAIFARYCVGFLVGTGETHAWVEIYSKEEGAWFGVDPTHNRLIEYDYIKIAHGRDAADCSVIRGVYRGNAVQRTQIQVVVEPLY